MPAAPSFLELCVRVGSRDAEAVERVAAEVWDAGASGVEERDDGEDTVLLVYAETGACATIERALTHAFGLPPLKLESVTPVVEENWTEAWKQHLTHVIISPRLSIRPSFLPSRVSGASRGPSGSVELVIDPRQAFGTGGHASTRLALEWIDVLAQSAALRPETRVLDVGMGTGILALAARSLGAGFAVGFDLDPLAAPEARRAAAANRCEAGVHWYTGPLSALRPGAFDVVVANLLKFEILPLAGQIAEAIADAGHLVVSGLLASELDTLSRVFEERGLRRAGSREVDDPTGDRWGALLFER